MRVDEWPEISVTVSSSYPYALSEGLARRDGSGAVWLVRTPHIAHVRVVATLPSTALLSQTARPQSHARVMW